MTAKSSRSNALLALGIFLGAALITGAIAASGLVGSSTAKGDGSPAIGVSQEGTEDADTFIGPNGARFGPLDMNQESPEAIEAAAPDFIAVWSPAEQRVVGYVTREDHFDSSASMEALLRGQVPLTVVYDRDGETVLGHMASGRGFIPLGVDPESVPDRSSVVPASPDQHR